MRKFLDITFPLNAAMTVWAGDPPVEIESVREVGKGSRSMVSRLQLSSHAGTHLDAPSHFIENGKTVDALDPAVLIGECLVVEVKDNEISAGVLDSLDIPRDIERVIFKTANTTRFSGTEPFFTDYVGISTCGAHRLVDMGIKLVGVDYLSAAAYSDILEVHHILLRKDIVLLETLNLKDAAPGRYELVCLPLKLQGVDGSPCRALLIADGE